MDRSEPDSDISEREVEDIEARSSPRTPVIYEIVCRLGNRCALWAATGPERGANGGTEGVGDRWP
jgi:hypothetical protein